MAQRRRRHERTQIALLDGKPAIGFQVSRTKGYDEARIARGVEQALAELKACHPDPGVTLVLSSVAFTLEQYQGSMNMLTGVLLVYAMLVLLLDGIACKPAPMPLGIE